MTPEEVETLIRAVLPDPAQELEPDHLEDLPSQSDVWKRFTGGDPGEVVIEIGQAGIAVSIFEVHWDGPHTPAVNGRDLARISWEDLPSDTEEATQVIQSLVDAARTIRRSKFSRCNECGDVKPPEWMHDDRICQSCAEKHHGIVY